LDAVGDVREGGAGMSYSFKTTIEQRAWHNGPWIDLDVEVFYSVEDRHITIEDVNGADDTGDFSVPLELTREQQGRVHDDAVDDYQFMCDRAQAMAEDAAESRAEYRREMRAEELAMRGRQYADGQKMSVEYMKQEGMYHEK